MQVLDLACMKASIVSIICILIFVFLFGFVLGGFVIGGITREK